MYESQTTRRLSHAPVASLSWVLCCFADGHGEAPLQQSNTDPVTDALYTINFAALGLREAVAATQNSTLAAAEAKLSQYLTRIQQRSASRPELDGAWMRAFDYEKWEVQPEPLPPPSAPRWIYCWPVRRSGRRRRTSAGARGASRRAG